MPYYLKLITLLVFTGGQGVASFSIRRIGKISGFSLKPKFLKLPSFATKEWTIRTVSSRGTSTTALRATPEWALYVLSHNAGGIFGTPVVAKAKNWYQHIPLLSWTPPKFLFSPVWTLLYSLVDVSVFGIVKSRSSMTNLATKLWTFQYTLNLSCPPVFFGFQNGVLASSLTG